MAYTPYGYPQYYGQPQNQLDYFKAQQMQPQQMPQQGNGLLWVQGEAGAKAYPVAPGSSVLLMDSEGNRFYLKSADVSGMPSMRVFDYTERTAAQNQPVAAPTPQGGDYVTRAEFNALAQKLAALMPPEQQEVTDEKQPV